MVCSFLLKRQQEDIKSHAKILTSLTTMGYENWAPKRQGKVSDFSDKIRHFVRAEELHIKQYGFIAEEVEELFPELVGEFQGEIYGVKYEYLTPLLVQEVQKQNKRLINLEEKDQTIADLKASNQKMENMINDLVARMQTLETRA